MATETLNIIEREPPFKGIRRDKDSLGIVWFDDPFIHFRSEDPGEWIDGIERKFIDARPVGKGRTPFHFYISDEGDIFEGLGWGAYSDWHGMGKNQDFPHDGGNSVAVMYLGDGELMTSAAKTAAAGLVRTHQGMYNLFRTVLYHQVFDVTPNGAGGKRVPGSLAQWVREGCVAPQLAGEENDGTDGDSDELVAEEASKDSGSAGKRAAPESTASKNGGKRTRRRSP
jgi:hypothetical protein